MFNVNPITRMDFPHPDIIRVEDVYYMLSSTWHFMPGGAILRSYDLQNWELVSYLFQELEGNEKEQMLGEQCNYGKGMEAGKLYYHAGKFYATFFARWYDKLFLFTADQPEGPWTPGYINGGFFDGHLLFDQEKTYVVFGHGRIWITELKEDLSEAKPGGFSRLLIEDTRDHYLPFCGPRMYHIDDHYYLFVSHWPKTGNSRRCQYCFTSDSLEGNFFGREIFNDDDGYHNSGVAQGGLVDTPNGKWYFYMYQLRGALGRTPYIVPMRFENAFPVIGNQGKMPNEIEITSARPYYPYEKLFTSDDFIYQKNAEGFYDLKKQWQWNHAPNKKMINFLPGGGMEITTDKISTNVIHAQNVLTQRMFWPQSEAEVVVDASGLKDGDIAGICAFQACYGLLGITKEMGNYYLTVIVRDIKDSPMNDVTADYLPGTEVDRILLDGPIAKLKINAEFSDKRDTCEMLYEKDGNWVHTGKKHDLYFKMDHCVGCRYGLFVYSTKNIGGKAVFQNFIYR